MGGLLTVDMSQGTTNEFRCMADQHTAKRTSSSPALIAGQGFLDAAVRNEPDQGDQDVHGLRQRW